MAQAVPLVAGTLCKTTSAARFLRRNDFDTGGERKNVFDTGGVRKRGFDTGALRKMGYDTGVQLLPGEKEPT